MKQRNLKKKAGALLLAAAMTVNLFPTLGSEVYAAELLDNTQFATVEELKVPKLLFYLKGILTMKTLPFPAWL